MELVYRIKIEGFDKVSAPKAFYKAWLQEGTEALFNKARALISGEIETNRFSSQPRHGRAPKKCPGWVHVGCLGSWLRGNPGYANCHCLEVFRSPDNRYFLVDQIEEGDFSGHEYWATVIEEIPMEVKS